MLICDQLAIRRVMDVLDRFAVLIGYPTGGAEVVSMGEEDVGAVRVDGLVNLGYIGRRRRQ